MADRQALVHLLRRVREAHGLSQADVEVCMGLAPDTYRHIERGRRLLPDLWHGLVEWVRQFEACVGATTDERKAILEALSRAIIDRLAELLDDLRQANGGASC